MKCDHEYVFAAFVYGGYWECERCGQRPTESQWNRWASKQKEEV